MIILLSILVFLSLLLGWMLLARFTLEVDTRAPILTFRWSGIGSVTVYFQQEWLLRFRVFFFSHIVHLEQMKQSAAKKKKKITPHGKKRNRVGILKKMKAMLRTFTVEKWQLAIDTGDYPFNALLFPINFLPNSREHVLINFSGHNYFYGKISNRMWKIIYAYWK